MTFVLAADRVFTPADRGPARVVVDAGFVVDVTGPGPADSAVPVLAPGFVDLQCNGVGNVSFASGGAGVWARAAARLALTGVTTVLPTLVSGTAVEAVLEDFTTGHPGPDFPGVHLEGPMLSPARHGAHPLDALSRLDVDAVLGQPVRLVTLAPELPGALDTAARLVSGGITVAAGHTDADADAAIAAFDAGVHLVTHLWNAMRPLDHRDPGIIGAALVDDRVRVCLIGDGVHVDPRVVVATWRAVGPRRFVGVTDSVAVTSGLRADGAAVRDAATGGLAGSAVTMGTVLGNLVGWGIPPADAIAAVSANAADAVGLEDRGRIEVGMRADLVVLDDELGVVGVPEQT